MENTWLYLLLPILIIDIYCLYDFHRNKETIESYKYRIITQNDLDILEETLNVMEGREFEIFCSKLFSLMGFKTELTPSVCDEGKDIILTDVNNNKTFVECKAWHTSSVQIGREVASKLIGASALYGVKKAIIVTTGDYHANAFDYADRVNKLGDFELELWGMYDILKRAKEINTTEVLRIAGIEKTNLEVVVDNTI